MRIFYVAIILFIIGSGVLGANMFPILNYLKYGTTTPEHWKPYK